VANLVFDNVFVNSQKDKSLRLSLSNQHAVERIAVDIGELPGGLAMKKAYWELAEAFIFYG
jgi:hypothetical protein